jgi:hypothetical protein
MLYKYLFLIALLVSAGVRAYGQTAPDPAPLIPWNVEVVAMRKAHQHGKSYFLSRDGGLFIFYRWMKPGDSLTIMQTGDNYGVLVDVATNPAGTAGWKRICLSDSATFDGKVLRTPGTWTFLTNEVYQY